MYYPLRARQRSAHAARRDHDCNLAASGNSDDGATRNSEIEAGVAAHKSGNCRRPGGHRSAMSRAAVGRMDASRARNQNARLVPAKTPIAKVNHFACSDLSRGNLECPRQAWMNADQLPARAPLNAGGSMPKACLVWTALFVICQTQGWL